MTLARIAATLLLTGFAAAGPAQAQSPASDYPAKPVRIVVPYTTGGVTDVMARLIAIKLSEAWGQQVIVENRVGAGGNIGMDAVRKSPADGYTMVLTTNAQTIGANLYPNLPFDLMRDFAPIGTIASSPIILVAHPKVAVNDLKGLQALLKAQPGKLTYGECGVGSPHHYAAELYKFKAGVDMVHTPYKGCSQSVIDVVGGQIDTAFLSVNVALPYVKQGRLKAIAVTSRARSAAAPEVPTFSESGVPELKDYVADIWFGFMAPAGVPPAILAKFAGGVQKSLDFPDVKARMAAGGIEAYKSSPYEMGSMMKTEMSTIAQVVKFAKMKIE